MIDYVGRKYGADRVVQIVTFGTLAARGVIRDVGRVMDLPYAFVDNIAKLIPKELNITLDKALKTSSELRKSYEEDPQVKELIDMSMTYFHACSRSCYQPEAGRRICAAVTWIRWICNDSVRSDHAGRAGTFENGLSGASHLDGDPGCREACKLQFRKRDQH